MTDQIHRQPANHGHRGARGRRPENTLAAVQYAIEAGADAAEVDLCVSADNVVIVHHDLALSPDLTRDDNGKWLDKPIPIRSLTADAIAQFNIGGMRPQSDYAKRFPQQEALPSASAPTLSQLIEHILASASDQFWFNLELKNNPYDSTLTPALEQYCDLVLEQVAHYDIAARTFVQSFDWRLIDYIEQQNTGILTGQLTNLQPHSKPRNPIAGNPNAWNNYTDLDDFDGSVPHMIAAAGSKVWSSNHFDLTREVVQQAHQLGLQVYVWTVNDGSDMQKMIDWDVDAITTDYPDRLSELLGG